MTETLKSLDDEWSEEEYKNLININKKRHDILEFEIDCICGLTQKVSLQNHPTVKGIQKETRKQTLADVQKIIDNLNSIDIIASYPTNKNYTRMNVIKEFLKQKLAELEKT